MDESTPQNHYETLNIPTDATLSTIRSAHRKLVLLCHPDRVQDPSARKQKAEQFDQVQQAYEVLSDEDRRQRYDEKRKWAELRAEMEERGSFPSRRLYGYPAPMHEFRSEMQGSRSEMQGNKLHDTKENDEERKKSTSSYRSSDSGYFTRTPSVAIPPPQHSYPIQSYPAQSYVPSPQLSQQSASYSYSNQRSPNIEVVNAARGSSSKHKERRSSPPCPSPPSEYPCLHPNCGHICSRPHDLKRHMTVHFPPSPEELLNCKYKWCKRTGAHGFKREDHRKEHYWRIHNESEYLKTRKGRQQSIMAAFRKETNMPLPFKIAEYPAAAARETNLPLSSSPNALTKYRGAKKKKLLLSSNSNASGTTAEAIPARGNLQPPKIQENLPDQENFRNIPDLKPDGVMLESSDARSVDWIATTSDGVETYSSAEKWSSRSDDENVVEQSEDSILDDPLAHIESENGRPTERIFDKKSLIASISYLPIDEKLMVIQPQILTSFSVGKYYASLKVEWDVLAFMEDQFPTHDHPNTLLGHVLTISGSAQHAQAMTCSEYIQQEWPTHGSRILMALQDALNSPTHTSHSRIDICVCEGSVSRDSSRSRHAELDFDVTHKKVGLDIKFGTPDLVADVVQQLAWMGAALRVSPDDQIQHCIPKLEDVSKVKRGEPIILNIAFDMTTTREEDQSCWLPLFKNPVIAHGFPIARRNDHEVGLEVPLDTMAALGGATHAVDFEGGLVLKGFSTLFVPVRRHKDSVQWHLICASEDDRIPYREASVQFPNRVLLEDLNHEDLRTTRAFLGWWPDAETHLATADASYESIEWSKAKEARSSPRITGGTLGISKIVSAQVNFVLGAKDGPFHHSQVGPFQKTIDRAERLPIVLYDYEDRRAWLVPALAVILHIIQLRNHIKPFVVGGRKVQISPLDPLRQELAAREAVAKNKSQKLFDCESKEEKEYCFRNAVLDTWSILDLLMERVAINNATPGMAVHATWQNVIYGWEFRDIAEEERHLRLKEQVLEKTAGHWYDLVKDVDAVVLFASGFGDVIKPKSRSAGLCQKWRSLQEGKDYLAVCVPMLENFYAKAGHREDHRYLTSAKLQWHRGSMLFEKCADITSNRCSCNRLQQVYRDTHQVFGHRAPPGNLQANGCVVFGQEHHPMKFHRKKKKALGPEAVNMLPNTPIRNGGSIRQRSTKDDCLLSPSPPTSVSPEPGKVNGHAAHNSTRPPSPLNVSDDIMQDKAIVLETGRRMSHTDILITHTYRGFNRCDDETSLSEDYAICPPEHQSIFNYDQDNKREEFASSSKTDTKPLHARRTVRRRAKIEDFGHPHGCTCTACRMVEFKPPGSIEIINTSTGTRRNSTNVAERRH